MEGNESSSASIKDWVFIDYNFNIKPSNNIQKRVNVT